MCSSLNQPLWPKGLNDWIGQVWIMWLPLEDGVEFSPTQTIWFENKEGWFTQGKTRQLLTRIVREWFLGREKGASLAASSTPSWPLRLLLRNRGERAHHSAACTLLEASRLLFIRDAFILLLLS